MKIEFGYDKHIKSWNVVVLDDDNNEIESSYSGDMVGVKFDIEYFKKQYDIKSVEKIKAY